MRSVTLAARVLGCLKGLMRKILIALSGLYLVGTLSAQPAASVDDNHWRDFRRKLIWKGPLVKTLLSAGFNQVFNVPKEWDRGVEGYGKRVGNAVGQRAIKATVELTASHWTHEDLRYHRLGQGGFFRRVSHAAVGAFWVPRDNGNAASTLAVGRIAGAFTASMVSRAWMPPRVATFGAGMQAFAGNVGADVGLNIFTEFWPRKH
ncbi:MAG: hypothetical protein ABI806_06890 [Candidatus Solibacter sp.]